MALRVGALGSPALKGRTFATSMVIIRTTIPIATLLAAIRGGRPSATMIRYQKGAEANPTIKLRVGNVLFMFILWF